MCRRPHVPERTRDMRKLLRYNGMIARGRDIMSRLQDMDDDELYLNWGAANRKQKRALRLIRLGHRMLEVRSLRFQAITARGDWPRP